MGGRHKNVPDDTAPSRNLHGRRPRCLSSPRRPPALAAGAHLRPSARAATETTCMPNIGHGTDVRSGNAAQSVQPVRTRPRPAIAVRPRPLDAFTSGHLSPWLAMPASHGRAHFHQHLSLAFICSRLFTVDVAPVPDMARALSLTAS